MPDTNSDPARVLTTPRVLVFFDYACQFCYLDWPRFKRLRAEHEVDMFLVPFELRPGMPHAGVPVSEVGGSHSPRVQEHMRRMAEEGGLGLVFPEFVPHTHKALVLGEHARDAGPGAHEAVHEAVFSAYSASGADIGDPVVLLRIAAEYGLEAAGLQEAWERGTYDERLHQFHDLALALGVSATPSALICNELFIGSRPYGVIRDSLEHCLVTPDTIERGDAEQESTDSEASAALRTEAEEGSPPTLDR